MKPILCCLFLVAAAQGVDLVRDGRAVLPVVVPDEPLPTVRFAAEELRDHVARITGAELAIVPEAEAGAGPGVYLGETRAARAAGLLDPPPAPDHGLLRELGGSLFLLGGDGDGAPLRDDTRAGTLRAVHSLLREFGVRWLWPGELGTDTPRRADLSWTGSREVAPRFWHSRLRFGGAMVLGPQGWASDEARQAYQTATLTWLRRQGFARTRTFDYGHAYTQYWSRFSDTHPEYFNLLPDGERKSDPTYHGGAPTLVSMCVSDDGFQQQVIADWLAARTPQKPWINGAENDTAGRCVCPHCLAWDAAPADLAAATREYQAADPHWVTHLGSLSDRYANYWLALQAKGREQDPEATVLGYAYANYAAPPVQTRLNERIIVGIVPAMMAPWTDAKRAAFREQWAGWAATGARLYLRPNYLLSGHDFPIFYAEQLAEDFRFAAARGMIATDFDSLTGQWATQGPNLYVLARLHEDPERSTESILGDYYAGFGPAAAEVAAYFDLWRKQSARLTDEAYDAAFDARREPVSTWTRDYLIGDVLMPDAAVAEAERLLDQAAAKAGEPRYRERVAFLKAGLEQAKLTVAVTRAYWDWQASGRIDGYREAVAALDAYRAEIEHLPVSNMSVLGYLEQARWDRQLLRLSDQPGEMLPKVWRFRFDPDKVGEAEGWQRADYDDGGWETIGIESPWERQPPGVRWFDERGRQYDGYGWYRLSFELPRPEADERVKLVFGAVDESCVIWVNGRQVLTRTFNAAVNPNGWREAFEVDITDAVRYDAPNVAAVRVEDNSGDGGVWKPVRLVRARPLAANNLVPNGGFETDDGWQKSVMSGAVTFSRDAEVKHDGAASGRIDCTALAEDKPANDLNAAWARYYQADVPVEAGQRYRLTAWVRTEPEFRGRGDVWIRAGGKGDASAGFVSTGGVWRQVVLEEIVPTSEKASIYLNLRGATGTIWFDDVELVPVEGQDADDAE